MQALAKVDTSAGKATKKVDSSTCIICQSSTREKFVVNRSEVSYQVLSETITTLSSWNDPDCKTIVQLLGGDASLIKLKESNAEWHLSCYKKITHKKKRNTVAKKFQNQAVQDQQESTTDAVHPSTSYTVPFTRGQTVEYDKHLCFFCDGRETKKYPLHHVSYDTGGKNLKKAVEMSGNNGWKVRLSECISETDAHAIDVLYHRECWAKNVVNVLRKASSSNTTDLCCMALSASDVEFISLLTDFLESGNVACMADLHTTYLNICSSNGLDVIDKNVKSRRQLKSFIECEIPCVVFSCPKRKNASERVSLKTTADAALIQLEEGSQAHQFKVIYEAAKLLRKIILKRDKWNFEGNLCSADVVPEEVSLFFKWCLVGKNSISSQSKRGSEIDERTNRLSQTLMYECLSSRQVSNSAAESLRHTREMPMQVAVGLSVHQSTRSAQLVEYLHNIGVSVPYARILDIETRIARSVLAGMKESQGIYVPPDFVNNRFTHFAIDNIDFQEDTPDGKNTLHGTMLVAYQTHEEEDESAAFTLVPEEQQTTIPDTMYEIATCNLPKNLKPRSRTLTTIKGYKKTDENNELLNSSTLEDLMWILASTVEEVFADESTIPARLEPGLTWAAYNSLINEVKPKTKISVLPIIPETPTDNSVQVTAMQNLERINKYLQGNDKKLIVTLDLGLYRPVLQLQMALSQRNWFLVPGDLHIQMAQLRAIGNYIELTGIPEAWVESGLYSETTVKHILDGKPVRRSLKAHIVTVTSLSILLLESFFEENHYLKEECSAIAIEMRNIWKTKDRCDITTQSHSMRERLKDLDFPLKLENFCKEKSELSPTFKMVKNYMDMVFSMLAFARSTRNANWNLRIAALDDFTKYFFALDLRNYASLCAWHIAEVRSLEILDHETSTQLKSGNWYPNKSNNPFCCLGVDEALEQENRRLKVLGGIVGITRRQQTLTKYFLASPEIAKLTRQADVVSSSSNKAMHHEVNNAISTRQNRNVIALLQCFRSYTNPFQYSGPELVNLLTMFVAPENVENDVCGMPDIGMKLYTDFVDERIVEGKGNLWDTLHKTNLQLCRTTAKKVKIQTKGGTIELKEDRALFNRLIVLCRSRPDMDLRECISKYELTVVPRALFSGDGTMHHVSEKSKLIHHIEELIAIQFPTENDDNRSEMPTIDVHHIVERTPKSVAIIDGMAELQSMKLKQVSTCSDLADQFCDKIFTKYRHFSEIHIVFDTYIDNSLKAAERLRRRKGIPPIQYKIEANTNIKALTLQKLLSHIKTKDSLTEFLSKALLASAVKRRISSVVAYRETAEASELSVAHLKSSHEEADAKLIFHAIDATKRGASSLCIFSPDTDVLILAVHNYPHFPKDSDMVISGAKRREISLGKAYSALGADRAAALLGMHAISGADVTGAFNGKGKTSFWRRFIDADEDVLKALASLGDSIIKDETYEIIEKYVCTVYLRPTENNRIYTLKELRWWFFTQKQAVAGHMPPTSAALRPAVRRANYQSMEWSRCDVPHPSLPPAQDFGWKIEDGQLVPELCDLPCGPEELISLTKCSCSRGRCAQKCKCVLSQLPCTEMCACLGEEQTCDNIHNVIETISDDEEEDSSC